jgi:phosphodiesterase/alkaline phosphatase D-like protein
MMGTKATLRVIFLDTRSHRDDPWLFSLANIRLPGTAYIAAALRSLYSIAGVGRRHTGDILGEKQWDWLTETLTTSTADFHIVVSSIQILTSNPVVESWGHFPLAKQRLIDTFAKHDPKGLVLLSGDVHHAEVSEANITRFDGKKSKWLEVTSSGLTHSCGGALTKLCHVMLSTFVHHRHKESVYIGKNFGIIGAIDSNSSGQMALRLSIHSLESDMDVTNSILQADVISEPSNSKIVRVDYAGFPQRPLEVCLALFLAFTIVALFAKRLWAKQRKTKTN